MVTPRLKYTVDDFKEEEMITLTRPCDKTQKPAFSGLKCHAELKTKTSLGVRSSNRDSPSKSHPVLYLDLANDSKITNSHQTHFREEDMTMPHAKEVGHITVECKVDGDAKEYPEQHRSIQPREQLLSGKPPTAASIERSPSQHARLRSEPSMKAFGDRVNKTSKKLSSPSPSKKAAKYSSPGHGRSGVHSGNNRSLKQMVQMNS